MCGIAGFLLPPSHSAAGESHSSILERMGHSIAHRGPDGFGFFHQPEQGVYLAHRRLSIVDISTGHQPMENEDGSLNIVFNGEIFNHASLRPGLEQAGHRYRSQSDTETILHGYEQFGPEIVTRLRGMFAFVIWDAASQTLFAARDRFGKKPFYYYSDGQFFAFASEIKALLAHPSVPKLPHQEAFPEYLVFGYLSGEQTLYRGIRKLAPGHWMRIRRSSSGLQIETKQYWDAPDCSPDPSLSLDHCAKAVLQGLEHSVQLRLMADVPLGSFLSGGVDSSAITALIRRNSSGSVKTFSVGYKEAAFSELSYARQVAEFLGTEHREVTVSREEFFSELPRLIWHEDEPIAWPSSVSLYFVSRLAAQDVKVVLTGEGSDEIFAGYERYRWHMLNQKALSLYGVLPAAARRSIASWISSTSLLRAPLRRKLFHTFLGRDSSLESLYLDNFYGTFSPEAFANLLPSQPSSQAYQSYLHFWNQRPHASLLSRLLFADQKTYLVELLMKQDQMSMAASIESRVPFLDHEFAAFAMSIPDAYKIQGNQQKFVFKKAVESLLPKSIIYRPKMGFPTPLRQWFNDPATAPLLNSLVAKDSFLAQSAFHLPAIQSLLAQHRSGLHDATDRLWRLLNLELWGQMAFLGKTPQ